MCILSSVAWKSIFWVTCQSFYLIWKSRAKSVDPDKFKIHEQRSILSQRSQYFLPLSYFKLIKWKHFREISCSQFLQIHKLVINRWLWLHTIFLVLHSLCDYCSLMKTCMLLLKELTICFSLTLSKLWMFLSTILKAEKKPWMLL